ncbi:MAG: LysR family transcriptional regulator [Pseudomonadota bacterium]
MLDINLIKVFMEVTKTGNILRASKNLRITQPGVSQKIKQLESHLGESLFIRKRSGMELNHAGNEFLLICNNIKNELDRLDNWIINKKPEVSGHIHITTVSSFITYVFPKFLKIFFEKYPEAKFTVKDARISEHVEENLIKGKSDIGIIIGRCKKDSLKIQKLSENHILMVCSKDYFLAKKKNITRDDLDKARIFSHAEAHSRTSKFIAKELGYPSEKDFGDIFLNDMEACKAHVLEGLGIAFVAKMYIKDELKKGKLVALPGFNMNRPAYIVSRNEKYESPLLKIFKKEFVDYCKDLDF